MQSVSLEVDESCLGGLGEGLRGRKPQNKALIVVAAQQDGRGIGGIRVMRIRDASGESPWPFVEQCLEPACVVPAEGWRGYSGLEKKGYVQEVTVVRGQQKSASELRPRVQRVVSRLKRWLLGTQQGAVSHQHLDDSWTSSASASTAANPKPRWRRHRARSISFPRLGRPAVDVKTAARFLGVSGSLVYAYVERKQIPHFLMMGRSIRFRLSELEEWRKQFHVNGGINNE